MQSKTSTPDAYTKSRPADRKAAVSAFRKEIKKNIPKGFKEEMGYGTMEYAVPHSVYPAGYHCDLKQPVPFIGVASKKNFIAVYHMWLYADKDLLKWFLEEYKKANPGKPDMGKSCLRFKKAVQIPYKLIG